MSETIGRRRSWLRATAMALAVTGALVACDDDDSMGPGGDGQGDVRAFVVDDPSSAASSVADRVSPSVAAAAITGSLAGEARVDVSVDGTEWIQLGSLTGFALDLQSSTDQVSVSGQTSVPVDSYTMVRLVLDGVAAEVLAGSDIAGLVLTADATVTVGSGGQVVIERAVAFDVSAGTQTRIVFDLNSEQWITQTAVAAGMATEASVDASVDASATLLTQ